MTETSIRTESPLAGVHPDTTTTATIGDSTVAWDFGDLAAEYGAIRGEAARIDLSAAGIIDVAGDAGYDLLQRALARDLEFVTPEQSLISAVLDAEGRAIDVVTVYHADGGYRVETGLGRGEATLAHLEALNAETGLGAEVSRNTDLTLVLVEGPKAATVLEDTIEPDLGALPLSGLMEVDFQGISLVVSRTGFTGEYGYKIFVSRSDVEQLWTALGELTPAGIAALEIAMFEVRQPLVHREDAEASALENGYSWLIDITKEEFTGRESVVDAFEAGVRARVVGFISAGATEPLAPGSDVTIGGTSVGTLVYAVHSPGAGAVIGLVRLRPELVGPGIDIVIGDGVAATTLAAPYVIPVSWKTR